MFFRLQQLQWWWFWVLVLRLTILSPLLLDIGQSADLRYVKAQNMHRYTKAVLYTVWSLVDNQSSQLIFYWSIFSLPRWHYTTWLRACKGLWGRQCSLRGSCRLRFRPPPGHHHVVKQHHHHYHHHLHHDYYNHHHLILMTIRVKKRQGLLMINYDLDVYPCRTHFVLWQHKLLRDQIWATKGVLLA